MKIFQICKNDTIEEAALIEITNNNSIIYKNLDSVDVDTFTDGFLKGLLYSGLEFQLKDELILTPDDDLFDELNFYNGWD